MPNSIFKEGLLKIKVENEAITAFEVDVKCITVYAGGAYETYTENYTAQKVDFKKCIKSWKIVDMLGITYN